MGLLIMWFVLLIEESVVLKDGDIFQEMSALGLPLSFQTSKNVSCKFNFI